MQTTNSLPANTENKNVQTLRMPVPKCAICRGKVALVSGVVIYDDKWYHSSCWKPSKK